MLSIEQIAKCAHEANRCYCLLLGDDSQPMWADAPEWQRESALIGVKYVMDNPDVTPEMTHESWLKVKRETGWVYGEAKDPELKTHPCMVEYEDLPIEQRIKDELFRGIVTSLI